ncbi:2-hydroxy-3-oxopropionate reductase [Kribbella speibonae]|uniref:2-hydroxy-3-oxopropionate reductase n=1 Tax=Kribbella speibonae TaxID=1572660 RepID=A0A4R0ID05_9ACTN|nr:2-hydroxy-3-oxopropionate reductase [Kribbella speibonae]TCC22674.1 2-hydroxy-3-oxopropionate reductase [Kribbella speibonae]TCC29046.1 2-hydroxy-3-oxopropionate reductase [Kribbella speibonae]
MRIGFIGLGVMGRPMADNLVAAGHELSVYRGRTDLAAHVCTSAKEVAERSEVVILMVPDTPDVEAALFAPGGAAEGLRAGSLVIDMSSISPTATIGFAQLIEKLGCDYLDAPVSGGELGARDGTLTIMVGGRPDVFERARPVFEVLGKNITLIGGAGAGQTAKVANQIIVGLTIEAVAEGLLFAERAGADPAVVRQALMGGFASSRILEVHGERMVSEAFEPGFRLRLHRKDLGLAVQAAAELDLALPNTAATQQLMNAAIADGDGELDHSALYKTLRRG